MIDFDRFLENAVLQCELPAKLGQDIQVFSGFHIKNAAPIFKMPPALGIDDTGSLPQNECHQRAYLVGGDDFYFWNCEKILILRRERVLFSSRAITESLY